MDIFNRREWGVGVRTSDDVQLDSRSDVVV